MFDQLPHDASENRLDLRALSHGHGESRWRTEAMRSHRSPRLIFVGRGQGRITVAGLTSGYGPNNLIFLPAGTMYGMEVGSTVYAQILTIPNAMATEWPDEPVHLRLRDVVQQKQFALIFDHLEAELRSDATAHTRAAHYQLGLLSVFFERQMQSYAEEERRQTAQARLVAAYTDLVERHYRSRRTVADYAAALGVTPTHLTRCCNRTCGRSAHTILSDRVLYEARLMLRQTRLPMKRIAEDLGYTTAAYFSRAFTSETGMTPSAFRRMGPLPAG
ncbi:transcriptional regulator, AraC family protein [Oceanicola granulosus HTCC2516]|uniref:Transcriptional regulator, AraC family protein n=1 Tax=Oceanicola granulosus (strain ATCC BAA-861 / DSM 15982 / KCTC 12143 / HTCC2516) TaxID=314256 RepID=Q2CE67_OCEGH|nr:AraC family transcriptional regulator [Oceanicola granulosus]EAR50993.1 transcriptional regulator, AraC family protein [Oceanicola granulosus HTCC2516]